MSDDELRRAAQRFHDPRAESDLIGHVLTHPHDAERVLAQIGPDQFVLRPAATALTAINELWTRGVEISALTVADASLALDPEFDRVQLLDWMGNVNPIGSVEALASRLTSLAVGRRVRTVLRDGLSRLAEEDSDPLSLASALVVDLEGVESEGSQSVPLSSVASVAARSSVDTPALIPGLLYRGDAVIVVAGEGVGKSQMARQVALCAEAGLHPFTRYPIPPLTVFTVDLENKKRAMTDGFARVLRAIRRQPGYEAWEPQGMVWEQPAGLDLLSAVDRRRLTEAIRRTRPDLVIFGPIYKAYRLSGPAAKEDAAALQVTSFFDDLRARFDFGMWIEAHAPFGQSAGERDLRPYGTTVWQRWPEYGKSFRWDEGLGRLRVGSFRGDRTRVWWPQTLVKGIEQFPFTGRWESPDIALKLKLNEQGFPD